MRGLGMCSFVRDLMNIFLTIKVENDIASVASKKASANLEKLLDVLATSGIDITEAKIDTNRVDKSYGEEIYTAEKTVQFIVPFSMEFSNVITEIVEKLDFDVKVSMYSELSDLHEKHESVLQDALMDSKHKAERMAASLGMKVVGVESIKYGENNNFDHDKDVYYMSTSLNHNRKRKEKLSDKLKASSETMEDYVDVIWKVE